MRGSGIARERTAERDHGSDVVGHELCDLPCEDAAQAPADEAHLGPVTAAQIVDPIDDLLLQTTEITLIATELPAMRGISVIPEEASQGTGGNIACHQAGQHQNRMAIALRRQA